MPDSPVAAAELADDVGVSTGVDDAVEAGVLGADAVVLATDAGSGAEAAFLLPLLHPTAVTATIDTTATRTRTVHDDQRRDRRLATPRWTGSLSLEAWGGNHLMIPAAFPSA